MASDRAAWAKRADDYFHVHKDFNHAQRAYRKAGLLYEAKIADAYFCRQKATLHDRTDGSSARSSAFSEAAAKFQALALVSSEAGASSYFRIAGECYLQVPEYDRAAKSFLMAGEVTQACLLYRKLGNFEQVVEILRERSTEIKTATEQNVRYAARLFYLTLRKFKCVR